MAATGMNNLLMPHAGATNSTQSSNNFYENTMNSANSSIHKRKSVISSQSTGSSNEVIKIYILAETFDHTFSFPGSDIFHAAASKAQQTSQLT